MRRLLVLLALAVSALVSAARPAAAHPSHWLTANGEVRRDGTYAIDVFLDREFVPDRFGREAPAVDIAGLPPAKDLRTESYGLMAAFAVVVDGKPLSPAALWVPPRKEEELHLRLSGTLPPGARTIVYENRTSGPWGNSVHQEGETDTAVSMLDPHQPMTPVEIRVVAPAAPPPSPASPPAVPGKLRFVAGPLLGVAFAWLLLFVVFRGRPWFRARVAVPAAIAIAGMLLYLALAGRGP